MLSNAPFYTICGLNETEYFDFGKQFYFMSKKPIFQNTVNKHRTQDTEHRHRTQTQNTEHKHMLKTFFSYRGLSTNLELFPCFRKFGTDMKISCTKKHITHCKSFELFTT